VRPDGDDLPHEGSPRSHHGVRVVHDASVRRGALLGVEVPRAQSDHLTLAGWVEREGRERERESHVSPVKYFLAESLLTSAFGVLKKRYNTQHFAYNIKYIQFSL